MGRREGEGGKGRLRGGEEGEGEGVSRVTDVITGIVFNRLGNSSSCAAGKEWQRGGAGRRRAYVRGGDRQALRRYMYSAGQSNLTDDPRRLFGFFHFPYPV